MRKKHWLIAAVLSVLVGVVVDLPPERAMATPANILASPDADGDVGSYTSIAVDANGEPLVGYYDADSGDLKIVECRNATCTAENWITVLDSAGDVGLHTSLAVDGDGQPALSYYDASNGDLKLVRCRPITGCLTVTSLDTLGDVGEYTSVALADDWYPVVSYYDATNGDLKVVRCSGATCSGSNTVVVADDTGDVGRFTSLALDAGDNPVVSYYDATNGDLKVLRCGDSTCSAGNTATTVDTTGDVGLHTSIALDASENPVVSYYDASNGDLKVLHCGDATCTTGNTMTSPVSEGDVGRYASLALDASGHPIVAYYDVTNGDLKVLHCGDASCMGGNSIASPHTSGDVGLYTSLALDSSGNPVLGYYDASHGDLMVLHCVTAGCNVVSNSMVSPDSHIDSQHTSLALNGSGNPVVAYNSHGILKILSCGNPTCTSGNTITMPDVAGEGNLNPSLALDAVGNPVVSYHDAGSLKLLHCGDPTCTSGNSIASPDAAGRDASLALDATGYPVISYQDSANDHLKVLHCGDPNCTSGNTIAVPDTDGLAGGDSSLAIDSAGNPVVSYEAFDVVEQQEQLRVLHCGDSLCMSGNTVAVVDVNSGGATSLALDASGNPVVSHYGNGDLKIAYCGNPTCTSGNVIAAPDTTGTVGGRTSLVLSESGNPVVSYYDFSNDDLKVLHCGNQYCTAGNIIVSPDTEGNVGWATSLALDASGNPVVGYLSDVYHSLKVLHCGNTTCGSFPTDDFDGDGCADTVELQTDPNSELSGGLRDPKNPWDYFNPTQDGQNRVDDILAVVNNYFLDVNDPKAYATVGHLYDRTSIPDVTTHWPWRLGPPNGQIRVDDILHAVNSYFHDCA